MIKGSHCLKETKKKMSKAHKGKITWNKGKKLSEEHKRNLSESLKGNTNVRGKHWKLSEETKRKLSEALKGRIFSEEHKKNLSLAFKGKMSGKNNPFYGRHHSEETKRKSSEGRKGEKGFWWGKHLPIEIRKKISDM